MCCVISRVYNAEVVEHRTGAALWTAAGRGSEEGRDRADVLRRGLWILRNTQPASRTSARSRRPMESEGLFLNRRQHRRIAGVQALRMSEAAFAGAVRDVEDDVVGPGFVAGDAADPHQMIEAENRADAPRDVVVCARRVAADAEAADHSFSRTVKAEPSAEHIHAA